MDFDETETSYLMGIDRDDILDPYRDAYRPSPVVIKNCVATAYFGTRLDLEEISWQKHGEFNPRSFAAAKLRLSSPSTTALLFASGKIVCAGAGSEAAAHVAVLRYYKMVCEVVPNALCLDICIQNIVGTAYLGHSIDLSRAYLWLQEYGCVQAMYSPELFPGLRFKIKDFLNVRGKKINTTEIDRPIDTKVLAFHKGNIVICGAKNRSDLLDTWIAVRKVLDQFRCLEVIKTPLRARKRTRHR